MPRLTGAQSHTWPAKARRATRSPAQRLSGGHQRPIGGTDQVRSVLNSPCSAHVATPVGLPRGSSVSRQPPRDPRPPAPGPPLSSRTRRRWVEVPFRACTRRVEKYEKGEPRCQGPHEDAHSGWRDRQQESHAGETERRDERRRQGLLADGNWKDIPPRDHSESILHSPYPVERVVASQASPGRSLKGANKHLCCKRSVALRTRSTSSVLPS